MDQIGSKRINLDYLNWIRNKLGKCIKLDHNGSNWKKWNKIKSFGAFSVFFMVHYFLCNMNVCIDYSKHGAASPTE